jgi:Tol biopolymer transport system component
MMMGCSFFVARIRHPRWERAIILVSICLAVGASPAGATSPGRDGRLAYMVKDGAGHWQIWVASARLSGAKQLTRGPYDSGWPVWSPDGKTLVFDSPRSDRSPNDHAHVNDVFLMKADGSGVKKLTDSKGGSGDAAWSPNGSLIAFDADRGDAKKRAIYVINASGGKIRRLEKPPKGFDDYKPRFSPDGRQVAFSRARGTAEGAPSALFTMRLDGTHLRRLTSFSLHVDDTDWSPNGRRIVIEAYPNPAAYGDIYDIDASGGRPVNLTRNPAGKAGCADPIWSPDGKKILFLDNRVVDGVGRTGLATMNPDGSNRRFVSSRNLEIHQVDWETLH